MSADHRSIRRSGAAFVSIHDAVLAVAGGCGSVVAGGPVISRTITGYDEAPLSIWRRDWFDAGLAASHKTSDEQRNADVLHSFFPQ